MRFSIGQEHDEYGFHVGKVGYEHCSPEKGPVARVRPNYSWHFVLFGRGTLIDGDAKLYKIKKGESFLLYQGEYYDYYPDPQDPWTYFWVELTGDNLDAMFSECGFSKKEVRLSLKHFDAYVELLKSMKDAFDESDVQLVRVSAYLLLIISNCIERVREGRTDQRVYRRRRLMRDILIYVNNNFNLDLTNEEIAAENNLSVRSLTSLFAEMVGMTPVQYLTAYRIAVAAERFQETDMSVAEVAKWSGFYDEKYFSRVFKREKGMTPQEYKRLKPKEDAFALIKQKENEVMK